MEASASPVPFLLAGVLLGVFAGVAGAWIRRIASRRMPPGMALIIGILAGGIAGAACAAVMPNQEHRMALIATAAAVGALTPWIATWRVLADGDGEGESTPSDPSRPLA